MLSAIRRGAQSRRPSSVRTEAGVSVIDNQLRSDGEVGFLLVKNLARVVQRKASPKLLITHVRSGPLEAYLLSFTRIKGYLLAVRVDRSAVFAVDC